MLGTPINDKVQCHIFYYARSPWGEQGGQTVHDGFPSLTNDKAKCTLTTLHTYTVFRTLE